MLINQIRKKIDVRINADGFKLAVFHKGKESRWHTYQILSAIFEFNLLIANTGIIYIFYGERPKSHSFIFGNSLNVEEKAPPGLLKNNQNDFNVFFFHQGRL